MSMKHLVLLLAFYICVSFAALSQSEISVVSWNIRDFGKTKSAVEVEQIANVLRDYDIVAIQEVVAGYGGSQAVARLADELNRMGSKWDYAISNPTASPKYKTEKYAFLWKTSKVTVLGKGKLIAALEDCVYREPFEMKFKVHGKEITLLNYHSRKFSEQPELEISCLSDYVLNNKSENVLLAGDFNLTIDHEVFGNLKAQQFKPCLNGTPTTLKTKCNDGHYLNYAIDNIIYSTTKNILLDCGAIDFVASCDRLEAMRLLSDHLPVYIKVQLL